jgi:hypothetical protein
MVSSAFDVPVSMVSSAFDVPVSMVLSFSYTLFLNIVYYINYIYIIYL